MLHVPRSYRLGGCAHGRADLALLHGAETASGRELAPAVRRSTSHPAVACGAIDPATDTRYVGTGHAGDFDSVLALNADNGAVRWKRKMKNADAWRSTCNRPNARLPSGGISGIQWGHQLRRHSPLCCDVLRRSRHVVRPRSGERLRHRRRAHGEGLRARHATCRIEQPASSTREVRTENRGHSPPGPARGCGRTTPFVTSAASPGTAIFEQTRFRITGVRSLTRTEKRLPPGG